MFAFAKSAGLGLAALAATAFANDADVSIGGSPKLLTGHATVRMQREKVVMTVGPTNTTVVCDFWFKNDGPACTVRMGFPDSGNADEDIEEGKPPPTNFSYFKSWVDGKPATTKLIAGEDGGWHVKTVRIGAHATVHVRDTYSATVDSAIAMAGDKQGGCKMASYTVHTGSSWKGAIGRTEIVVKFAKGMLPAPLRAVSSKALSKYDDGMRLSKAPFPSAGAVVYRGVSKPTVHGRSLTFVRTNWRPKQADDLQLWFAYRGNSNTASE